MEEISRAEIREVEQLIRPYVRRTPVIEVETRDFGLEGRPLALKLELMQHAGSFKTRGAFTNMLTREVPAAGVVAASGGNHGVAVAYAANKLGKPAHIFVPTVSSPSKQARIRGYGANLIVTGDRYADALAASETWQKESGALPIHAYDQRETLLGQGTIGLEFEEQVPELDTLLVAVGGGGLIAGIANWFAGRIRIVGVEPEGAPTLDYALRAGKPVDAPAGSIAADSLAPRQIGQLVFPILQRYVTQDILVTDDEIVSAQQALWENTKIAAEPGGATAFAALLSGKYKPAAGERVGVLICGGNTEAINFDRKRS